MLVKAQSNFGINCFNFTGQPQSFEVTVRPAPTFPLDVYFLMDFSASMDDDLTTLQSIAGDIGK